MTAKPRPQDDEGNRAHVCLVKEKQDGRPNHARRAFDVDANRGIDL